MNHKIPRKAEKIYQPKDRKLTFNSRLRDRCGESMQLTIAEFKELGEAGRPKLPELIMLGLLSKPVTFTISISNER